MFRHPEQDDLQAAIILQPEEIVQNGPRLYATDLEFLVVFGDESSVLLDRISHEDDELFEVYINGDISHRCVYRERPEGILIHIFKEQQLIKIAQGGESSCEPTRQRIPRKKRKKSLPPSPLKTEDIEDIEEIIKV